MKRKKLIDGTSEQCYIQNAVRENRHQADVVSSNPGTIPRNNKTNRNKKTARATTLHFIKTMTGQSKACRPRRLARISNQATKTEFGQLMKEGII